MCVTFCKKEELAQLNRYMIQRFVIKIVCQLSHLQMCNSVPLNIMIQILFLSICINLSYLYTLSNPSAEIYRHDLTHF